MPDTHDPYRNTAKITIQSKKNKERKKKFKKKNQEKESKGFFSQKINLDDYSNFTEGVRNFIGAGLFIFLPYLAGALFIFIIIARASMDTFKSVDTDSFLLTWTIGYELIALFILFLIFLSAINFQRK